MTTCSASVAAEAVIVVGEAAAVVAAPGTLYFHQGRTLEPPPVGLLGHTLVLGRWAVVVAGRDSHWAEHVRENLLRTAVAAVAAGSAVVAGPSEWTMTTKTVYSLSRARE